MSHIKICHEKGAAPRRVKFFGNQLGNSRASEENRQSMLEMGPDLTSVTGKASSWPRPPQKCQEGGWNRNPAGKRVQPRMQMGLWPFV